MGIINVLSKQIANLIAAGEVVERPVSVVKELTENSIDAGANEITVEITNGGSTHIRVTDNGCGMSRDDAQLAFARHATSKISDGDDLGHIGTMGFRGEALAAISSVANVQLITRKDGDDCGTVIEVNGGEIGDPDDIGAPVGTTMIVDNLFYNTPARLKFLKRDVTEAAVITTLLEKLAVANPNVSVKYIKDGRTVLQTGGDGMKNAVSTVFTSSVFAQMLEISYEHDGIGVNGYVGKGEVSRPNRFLQFFSVNGRVIRSRVFQSALEEALKNEIMIGKYPICAIDVKADFSAVDVNVHPSKLEVKFANERKLYDAVYFAVKNTFFADSSRPAFETVTTKKYSTTDVAPAPKQEKFVSMSVQEFNKQYTDKKIDIQAWSYPKATPVKPVNQVAAPKHNEQEMSELVMRALRQKQEMLKKNEEEVAAKQSKEPEQEKSQDDIPEFRMVGELFKTYIVLELEAEVLLIDKHAARERILFEKIKASQKGACSQRLLTPSVLYLTSEESATVLENLDFFERVGFELEDFGDGSIMMRGVPSDIRIEDAESLVTEAATKLIDGKKDPKPEIYNDLMHSMACKAAMKGGQYNADVDLENLATQIMAYPDIKHCPHGRPVALSLSKTYIESRFKR